MVYIRERAPDELELAVELTNSANPPSSAITIEQARSYEAWNRSETPPLYLLGFMDEQPVAYASSGHSVRDVEGRFSIEMVVRPEYRRRGIGNRLYERLVTYGRNHRACELACWIHEQNLPLVERRLAAEGFNEAERMRKSELRLTDIDPGVLAAAEERARAEGVTMTTLAEDDTEETMRKLWVLNTLAERDIPFDVPHPDTSLERFVELLAQERCLRDCLVVARDGDVFVGFTVIARQNPERATTWMTGVHPDYRNRGIAMAVKARSARLVRERGFRAMQTNNHLNNAPMLAVNRRLGYEPLPEVILFVKALG